LRVVIIHPTVMMVMSIAVLVMPVMNVAGFIMIVSMDEEASEYAS
jgi:hypothetical protein